MKNLLALLFVLAFGFILSMNYVFAQTDDPIVGTWKFEMNHKINYEDFLKVINSFNYDTTVSEQRAILFVGLAAVVVSRCESTEITFSPFQNEVMYVQKGYFDPTTEMTEWGVWKKIGEGRYEIKFENRIETYELNKVSGEYEYVATENNINYISFLLHKNLKLVKKKGD